MEGFQRRGDFFPQNRIALLSNFAAESQKIHDSSHTFQSKIHPVRPSSNQKGAISGTVCGWHVWILLRIPVARILWDFDFLRGLASDPFDGFSIGRYENNRESFDLSAAKFESGAIQFWGEKSPRRWNPFKTRFPLLSFYYKEQSTASSNSFKIAQKTALEAKGRLYTTGKVIQRLFIIDLCTHS